MSVSKFLITISGLTGVIDLFLLMIYGLAMEFMLPISEYYPLPLLSTFGILFTRKGQLKQKEIKIDILILIIAYTKVCTPERFRIICTISKLLDS